MEHVLMHCPVVWKCWSHMVFWWGQAQAIPSSVAGLLHWWFDGKLKPWIGQVWQIIPYIVFWFVWKLRNDYLFKGAQPDIQDLCEKIKVQIALWSKWLLNVDYSVHDIVSNLHQIRCAV